VLLVEDDAGVRAATTRLLESLGHQVVAHGDAAAALDAWRAAPAAIDLILSDVVMPSGGGPELVRALPAGHAARVLFMSGYANDAFKDDTLSHVPSSPSVHAQGSGPQAGRGPGLAADRLTYFRSWKWSA
jgi:CheY-like chemotaxis protein